MKFEAPAPPFVGPANRHGGSDNKPINHITIHCTVTPCATGARSVAEMFKRLVDRAASAHYVVDAKVTIQSLFDSYVAYHAPPNKGSLGIELCCSLSNQGKGHWRRRSHQKMLRNAARLCAGLCLAYDIPVVHLSGADLRAGQRGITGHADVRDAFGQTTHWDPGPFFPWEDFLRMVREEVAALQAPAPVAPAKPGKHKAVKKSTPNQIERANALLDQIDELLAGAVKNGRTGHVAKFRAQLRTIRQPFPKK